MERLLTERLCSHSVTRRSELKEAIMEEGRTLFLGKRVQMRPSNFKERRSEVLNFAVMLQVLD